MAEDAELVETFAAVTRALAEAKVDAAFIGAIAVIAWSESARRAKDELDLRAVFEAAAASKRVLDWASIARWCGEWGVADKLAPWRHEFEAATS